ncbi:protein kinase [Streptomyces sp. NPDC048514]|uniref:protein kinase domain-containing protein n=1 Tax=Streptomyces sp. NPDC048514 TaxID=3365564 RepID=UPI003720BE2F
MATTMASWRRGDVVLGLYEVLDVLDGGGMGLVYRVRHRGWHTDLAVKVSRPELMATAAGRSAFETEAGTWVGLAPHPHVVGCAYVRRVQDLPCVFAEWVEGGSLAELVSDGRLYEEPGPDVGGVIARILDLAVQIAWGIDHAHRQGVIHQDVKPANVMVDTGADWVAKVTDFGLAGARAAAGERSVVPPGNSLLAGFGGMTPAYCSPEQAEAVYDPTVSLSRATDVWSWALCVLEMFVGSPPCRHGQSAPEVFANFLEYGRPAPGAPLLPPALVELLWWCFEVDPARRPHRLDEPADAVLRLYEETVGVPYPRAAPQEARLLADGLSNQALSLLDLGRTDEAEELWRTAKDVDPHHLPTVYNWALYRWRRGSLSDQDVVSDLCTTRALHDEPARVDGLLGLVHLERGADETARALLADAPDLPEVAAGRAELARRELLRPGARLPAHAGSVRAAAVSADGSVAVTGGEEGRLRVWEPAEHRCRYVLPPEPSDDPREADAGPTPTLAPVTDPAPAPVTALALAPDGRTALVGRSSGPAELWDVSAGTRLGVLGSRRSAVSAGTAVTAVTAVALNGSGGAVVAYAGGPIEVWDTGPGPTGQGLRTGQAPQTGPGVQSARSAPAGQGEGGGHGRLPRCELEHPPSTFRRLDPGTGRILPEIHSEPSVVSAVALSADGRIAVSASDAEGSVVAWEVATGRPVSRIVKSADLHHTGFDLIALSADGSHALLSGRHKAMVQIWEPRTDRVRDTVPNTLGAYRRVALNGDATVAVSSSTSDAGQPVRVWETRTGRCVRSIEPEFESGPEGLPTPRARLDCAALSGDGRVLVLGDTWGGVHFHHLAPGGYRAPWSYARPRSAVALTDDEARVDAMVDRAAALAEQGRMRAACEQLRAARAVPGFERHPELREAWAHFGRLAGRRTDLLGIWQRYDLHGPLVLTPEVSLGLSLDADLAVTGGADGHVRVWDLQTGENVHTFAEKVANTHTVLIPEDCRFAVTADWGGSAHVWDFESGTRSTRLYGDQGHVRVVALDRQGRHALVGDHGGALCLWELRSGRDGTVAPWLVRTMLGHEGPVGVVELSHDGRFAASAGYEDRTGRLWATGTGVPVLAFPAEGFFAKLRFAPDDSRLYVTSSEGVTAWDVRTRRRLYQRQGGVDALALSADGRVAASPAGTTVEVWETGSGRTVCALPVFSSTFDVSPDGHQVVTADRDRNLQLWDGRTGRCVHTLEGHPEPVTLVTFTADGRNLVSADLRPGIRLWELDYDYDFTGADSAGHALDARDDEEGG